MGDISNWKNKNRTYAGKGTASIYLPSDEEKKKIIPLKDKRKHLSDKLIKSLDYQDKTYSVGDDTVIGLRIFNDNYGKMNISLKDADGSVLVISQFTLCGDWRKGRRPNFTKAADPDKGKLLYDRFIDAIRNKDINVETGEFGAAMDVSLINSGPVTFVLDSHDR